MRIKPIFVILLVFLFSIITVSIMADALLKSDLVVRGLRVEKAGVRKSAGARGPLSIMQGDKIGIRFSVVNKKGRSGPFHISVYFSTGTASSELNPSSRIFHIPVRSLSENQKALIINKMYKVPVKCKLGMYYVVVFADAENQVSEMSESNNKVYTRVKVKKRTFPQSEIKKQAIGTRPKLENDIAINNLTLSDSDVFNEGSFQVRIQVKNLGKTRYAQVAYNVCLNSLTSFAVCGEGSYALGTGVVRNIGPGETRNLNHWYTLPYDISDRYKRVCVIVNREHIREEKNPFNNSACQPITIHLKLPDLTITRLVKRVDGWPNDGASFDVDFTVHNRGTYKAFPCKGKIQFSYRETSYRNEENIPEVYRGRTIDIPEIPPGHSWPGSVNFTMPSYASRDWDYIYFYIKADINDDLKEFNDRNNSKFSKTYWK